MKLVPVKSSNILEVGYSKSAKEFFVRFKDGVVYRYLNVEESVFNAFLTAPSKGQFFHNFIKGRFTTTKLAPQELQKLEAIEP